MAQITLEGVCKRFGKTFAVRDVSLTIADREFLVFVGPSGCGKSTLLRLIAGLEKADGGRILIDGEDVTDTPPARRGLSMVFQSYALYPHMSVRGNIVFGLKMAKTPADEIARKVRDAAAILKLEEYLDKKPRELSGGQRQRVAIGRAIVRNPRGFLFDEPLSNLDAALRVRMRLEIVRLQRQLATTAIYVTHDQVEAMTMATRIAIMCDGAIAQVGRPLDLYRRPRNLFVARFIGSPAMNVFPCRVDGGGIFLLADAAAQNCPRLGARPEHIRLGGESGLPAQVAAVEALGADTLIYVQPQNIRNLPQPMAVRAAPGQMFAVGERVRFSFDPENRHLFDAAGDALDAPPADFFIASETEE